MLRTLWTNKTGLAANQDKLDAISNNIANVGTTGYKKITVGFKDLLSESLNRQGYPLNDNTANMGTGVRTTDWYRSGTQGNLTTTAINTDLCIDGENTYFRLTTPQGEKVYTRDGSFKIDEMGRLVDSCRNIVDIDFAPGKSYDNVRFATEELLINEEGYVYTNKAGVNEYIGKINLYTAVGDQAFLSIGDNLYTKAADANVELATNAKMYQGYIEGSNVDMASEFTDMIVTQRAFQLSSKSLQTADEMWGMINNIR